MPHLQQDTIDAVPDTGSGVADAAYLSCKSLCGCCMCCKCADYRQHGMSLNASRQIVPCMQKFTPGS